MISDRWDIWAMILYHGTMPIANNHNDPHDHIVRRHIVAVKKNKTRRIGEWESRRVNTVPYMGCEHRRCDGK